MRRLCIFFLTILLLCRFGPAGRAEEEKDVTVMIYMSGCDLESRGGAANADILEMIRSGMHGSRVNTVLLTGGTARWKTGFPSDRTGLYRIDPKAPGYYTEEALYPLMNMGDPETLRFFLDECFSRYPARDYILILWDHGGGPMMGVCRDQLFDGDMLTVPELKQALSLSGAAEHRLSMIGFDACLMSSLEVAAACAPYADYMVASQELEPGNGWNYAFLGGIENDGNRADTAARIIDGYFEASESKIKKGVPVTMACIDLRRTDELIAALNPVFRTLSDNLTPETFAGYSVTRRTSASVARSSRVEYDLVDLGSLLSRSGELTGADTAAAQAALKNAVAYHRSTREELTGLTVYFPYYNKDRYASEWGEAYPGISSARDYADLVRFFGGILTGEELAGWAMLETAQEEEEPGVFVQELTPGQRKNFVSAELVVLNHLIQDDSYSFSNRYGGVTVDGQGRLRAKIDNLSLYAADADGEPLTAPLTFWATDGFYTVKATVHRAAGDILSTDMPSMEAVDIRLRLSGEPGRLEIVDAITISDDGSMAGRSGLDLSEWDSVSFAEWAYKLPADSGGALPPYDEWPRSPMWYGTEAVRLADLDSFRFLGADLYDVEQYAYFEILDTQGERHAGPLFPVRNDHILTRNEDLMILEDPALTVRLDRVLIVPTGMNAGVTVAFTMEIPAGGNEMMLEAKNAAVNGTALDGSCSLIAPEPGKSGGGGFQLGMNHLRNAGVTRIRRISFQIEDALSGALYTAAFDTDIDLSETVAPADRRAFCRGESDGLTVEVYGCFTDGDGALILETGVINRTGRVIPLGARGTESLFVNGCRMSGGGTFESAVNYPSSGTFRTPPDLADGQTWYGLFRCPSRPEMYSLSSHIGPEDPDDFRAYGIQSVSSVEMIYPDFSIRLDFDTPLDYAGLRGRSGDAYPEWPGVLDVSAEERILIESVSISENNWLEAVIQWENRSGAPGHIPYWPAGSYKAAVNGAPDWFSGSTWPELSVGPGSKCRYRLKICLLTEENHPPVRSVEFPFVRVFGDTETAGPVIRIDFGTPLEKPGDRTEDFTVSTAGQN